MFELHPEKRSWVLSFFILVQGDLRIELNPVEAGVRPRLLGQYLRVHILPGFHPNCLASSALVHSALCTASANAMVISSALLLNRDSSSDQKSLLKTCWVSYVTLHTTL